MKHITVLVFKILADCLGKSLLGFTFIYSLGDGKFDSLLTLAFFYSTFCIMVIFHTVCNNSPVQDLITIEFWIGKRK